MRTSSQLAPSVVGLPFFDGRISPAPTGRNSGLESLDTIGAVQSVRAGCELYAEGDAAASWYRVNSGILRTYKLLPDGRRQIDEFLFPGDYFGLESGADHDFATEAVTAATVIRYSRARLGSLVSEDAHLSAQLLQVTLGRLNKAHGRMLLLGRKNAGEKLASFLLEMLDRSSGRNTIDLAMSRTDIADYLGLTIETVSRTFPLLKQEGVVELPNAHHVVVIDRQALEDLTGDE